MPAVSHIDMDIPPCTTVALVGASGAGKSTLIHLIPRFFDVDYGAITIDGQDIRDVQMASLRQHIAIVSQDTQLFDDTVRANILYGKSGAGEADIVEAARAAFADEFIRALPDGYDTRLGVNGLRLSGGQRQRITIARALLRDAPILLLDEATAALDSESETMIQQAMARLRHNRTCVVIAHRFSTIRDADCIYVIGDGRVAERGTHAELMRTTGAYARLNELQQTAS